MHMSLTAALQAAHATAHLREKTTVTPPGQRWVPVTVEDFTEILAPVGFLRDDESSHHVGQVVFSKASRIDAAVFLKVYTSIPLHGSTARGVGEDSIKVALVRKTERGCKPLIKKLPYACRTRGWRTILLNKLEEQMRKFGPACPLCGGATFERETKDQSRKFHGCVRFPECKGIGR
jgi:hypothetical protein